MKDKHDNRTIELHLPRPKNTPHDFEELVNTLTGEREELLAILDNIVCAWHYEAPLEQVENLMQKAQCLLAFHAAERERFE